MTTTEPIVTPSAPLNWTVFCAAIDNYGDMGVCWRLAQQLHREHGTRVAIWVDDWDALCRFLAPLHCAGQEPMLCEGVTLRHWHPEHEFEPHAEALVAATDVLVEAFACTLPEAVRTALANTPAPPLWLNLEYLSAEDWVPGCHGLSSLYGTGGARTLRRYFFFPGFVAGTGGLLREANLVEQHRQWQGDLQEQRARFLAQFTALPVPPGLWLSLFTYEGLPLCSLLQALSESAAASFCLVPEGRSLRSVAQFFALQALPAPGTVLQRGSLTILVLPFMSQHDYDWLLSLCAYNFVRGEDSFVRAQFSGRPLLWQLYPQEEGAHFPKLEAFLALYCSDSAASEALKAFWRAWNQGEDCRILWHHLRPQLPTLRRQAKRWQQKLAEKPDLVANLLQFCGVHSTKTRAGDSSA